MFTPGGVFDWSMTMTGRMIDCDTWEDDFVTGLSIFERLLWIGILTTADDQGRMQSNPAMIRSKIFPLDDIPLIDITNAMQSFLKTDRLIAYTAGGKQLIQIVNWWKHQKPRYAGPSKYLPPDGWTDRENYNSAGNVIIKKNWEYIGGFDGHTLTPTPTESSASLSSSEYVKDKVKDKVNDNDNDNEFSRVQRMIEVITGMNIDPNTGIKAVNELIAMKATEADIRAGHAWLIDNKKRCAYYGQLVGPTRTAMSIRVGGNGHKSKTDATADYFKGVLAKLEAEENGNKE